MLQRTTTVPDTDLPTYLDAYVSLCGTDSDLFDRRFETLSKQFRRPWSELRHHMAISVAEPKERTEDEVDKAFASFKLAYKKVCEEYFSKQLLGPMKRFIRDIFGDKNGFMEYLRSGAAWG
jgi:hypothetical protein